MSVFKIGSKPLSIGLIQDLLQENTTIGLTEEAKKKIVKCRTYLDKKLKNLKEPIYGINTGFGALYNKSVPENDLEKLQENLVISHACGTGNVIPVRIAKLMLMLKVQGLAFGNSGVQLETVERLIYFYNHDIIPVVYESGSLGASGDLAPLAHLSLPLIGLGEVFYKDEIVDAGSVLKKLKLKPLQLKSKEGLALLNGTQFMSAYATECLIRALHLASMADLIACTSLDAFDGRMEPFDERIQLIRPHQGQMDVAENIRMIMEGSEIAMNKKKHVQDPYSFRCIPQVHGAGRDAINYVANVVEIEINSVTDNPTIFPDDDAIISAGNFHGQPLALTLDFLAIAMAEFGSISERRTYLLISGQRDLPPFLVANPGLNSGFMIPQYTAASLVSKNKQLCTPASVDSIVSSNGQEDHVSMGANAAVKAYHINENLHSILAIELMTAAQALEFRRPLNSSPTVEAFVEGLRKHIPFLEEDNLMYVLMRNTEEFLNM